jgi:hypothetical protein
LVLDDEIGRRLREEAQRRQVTMSALAETALLQLFTREYEEHESLPPLPTRHSGGLLIDIADGGAMDATIGCALGP